MEPHNDSLSMRDPLRLDCDGDKARNLNGPPKQRSANDNVANVFTSPSNDVDASLAPQNGPRPRQTNSTSYEPQTPHNSSEGSSEFNKNDSSVQCNTVKNCNSEPVAGSSRSDNNVLDNKEQHSLKRKVCSDKVGNNSHIAPSTSGTNRVCDNADRPRENRKRPSSLKLNRPPNDDDSSSDTGNDDYSLGSEDGCIYTYRGGEHLADLPSSFFSLDMGLPLDNHLPPVPNYPGPQQGVANARENNSRASSPDMDFLEMDFDPGPSCEADTGDESSSDVELEAAIDMPEENEPVVRGTSPEYLAAPQYNPQVCVPTTSTADCADMGRCSVSSNSCSVPIVQEEIRDDFQSDHMFGPLITHVNVRGEQLLVHRTMSVGPPTVTRNLHIISGDLITPQEVVNYEERYAQRSLVHQISIGERPTFDNNNLSIALFHLSMAKRLLGDAETDTDDDETNVAVDPEPSSNSEDLRISLPPRCMVWSEREACDRQVTQIGTSACGATAVINVFIALGVPINVEIINAAVGTRMRANNAPLPRYLLSRAVAGCTAADLVAGIQKASDGLVTARFFPTYPERAVSLSHWLADWIALGAVPILTLNLQAGCLGEIPDAWHHQMVFGVSDQGIYLTNPVECIPESTLWPRLTSPSVLMVRTRDALTRYTPQGDLTTLMMVPDRRFHTFNVLGQVVNVIRQWRAAGWADHSIRTRYIRIPASYQAGVTVVALTGTEAHRRLMHAAQLPIIGPKIER